MWINSTVPIFYLKSGRMHGQNVQRLRALEKENRVECHQDKILYRTHV